MKLFIFFLVQMSVVTEEITLQFVLHLVPCYIKRSTHCYRDLKRQLHENESRSLSTYSILSPDLHLQFLHPCMYPTRCNIYCTFSNLLHIESIIIQVCSTMDVSELEGFTSSLEGKLMTDLCGEGEKKCLHFPLNLIKKKNAAIVVVKLRG